MVDHSTHNPKIKGSNPAAGIGRKKITEKRFLSNFGLLFGIRAWSMPFRRARKELVTAKHSSLFSSNASNDKTSFKELSNTLVYFPTVIVTKQQLLALPITLAYFTAMPVTKQQLYSTVKHSSLFSSSASDKNKS